MMKYKSLTKLISIVLACGIIIRSVPVFAIENHDLFMKYGVYLQQGKNTSDQDCNVVITNKAFYETNKDFSETVKKGLSNIIYTDDIGSRDIIAGVSKELEKENSDDYKKIVCAMKNFSRNYDEEKNSESVTGEIVLDCQTVGWTSEYEFKMVITYADEKYKDKLKSLHDKEANVRQEKYEDNELRTFNEALNYAEYVLQDKKALKSEVDEAYSKLLKADSCLKEKEDCDEDSVSKSLSNDKFKKNNDYNISNNVNIKSKVINNLSDVWVYKNTKYYYYDSYGNLKKGWFKTNAGNWYKLDNNTGEMLKGWYKENNDWYYLDNETGVMVIGWILVGGKWYHMNKSGVVDTGWFKDSDGKWYNMGISGALL